MVLWEGVHGSLVVLWRQKSQCYLRLSLRLRWASFRCIAIKVLLNNPFGKKFWDQLVHSRIVEWQKAFGFAIAYIVKNQRETSGEIPFTPRKRKPGRPKCDREAIPSLTAVDFLDTAVKHLNDQT